MLFRFLVGLLICVLIQEGNARVQAVGLQTLQTRFYELHTDLDEGTARALGSHMDVVFEAYGKMFERFQGHPTKRLDAYIFRTQTAYLEFLRKKYGVDGTGSGGMFLQRGDDGALVVFEGGQGLRRVREVLQHEGFHQYAAILFPGIPLWANEGFAELFENGVVIDGEIDEFHVGSIPRGTLQQLKRARAENGLLPFDSFFLIDSKAWSRSLKDGGASLNYMQAWSLVHFFLYAEEARWQDDFLGFLGLLNKGMDWQQAFSSVFKTSDYSEIQDEYIRWLDAAQPTSHRAIIHELEYLATGMHALHGAGIHPNTARLLRQQLKSNRYEYESHLFGEITMLSETHPGLFELQLDGPGSGATIVLADDRGRPLVNGAPPGSRPWNIRTLGLKPFDYIVRWKNAGGRNPTFMLEKF
ncbi:MAG: hypothetical protein CMJ36_02950 [Phycisphaerae bacterium]|nr:hypothetical protein [Phycisphaerae bacterium]